MAHTSPSPSSPSSWVSLDRLSGYSLSDFIWFLVVLNILLFLYIQINTPEWRKRIRKSSNIQHQGGSSLGLGMLGHWCGGGFNFLVGAATVIDLQGQRGHDIYPVKTPDDYCVLATQYPGCVEVVVVADDAPDGVLVMEKEKLRGVSKR